jgi:hypothetical protein
MPEPAWTNECEPESDEIRDMRLACAAMGLPLSSTDRFVTDAIRWLTARCDQFAIEWAGDSWVVVSKGAWVAGDETLASALCGAVFVVEWIQDELKARELT